MKLIDKAYEIESNTSVGKCFDFILEKEKLLINIEKSRETSRKYSEIVNQIHYLYEEVQFRRADLLALEAKLSSIVMSYGLEPISSNGRRTHKGLDVD